MALDLSKYETTADTPEVAALKKKVKEVTKKYTDRHGWCDEAQRALREMGIEPAAQYVVLKATTSQGLTFDVKVEVGKLIGKTEAQQKKAVVDTIGPVRLRANSGTIGTLTFSPDDLTDISLDPLSSEGGRWMYATNNGRVMHWYPADREGAEFVYSLCGGYDRADWRTIHSPRGTGGNCAKCMDRLA